MSLAHSLKYELSPAFATHAAEAFLRTRATRVPLDARFWKSTLILLLCGLVSVALAVMGYLAQVPVVLLFVPLALAGLFGTLLFLVAISFLIATTTVGLSCWAIRRRLLAGIPKAHDRTVRWTFTDEGFQVQTAENSRQVRWTELRRVLVDPDFWFLQVHDGPELVLPVGNLSAAVKDRICKRVESVASASLRTPHLVNEQGAVSVGAIDFQKVQSHQQSNPWGPLPKRPSLERIQVESARNRFAGQGSFGRFLGYMACIAGTMFFLQATNLIDGHFIDGRLLVIVAVASGAAFAMACMIQRVARKARVCPEETRSTR